MSSSAPLDPIHDPAAIAVERESSPRRGGMRFGLFGGAQARCGDGDPARGFRDYVETCVKAEALGFASSFLVEHHFSGLGQVSEGRGRRVGVTRVGVTRPWAPAERSLGGQRWSHAR